MSIVILAAGQGTRMKSSRPKVLHQLAGKPLLQHVVDASRALEPQQVIVVVGHGAAKVRETMQGQPLQFIEQAEQLGTGHAVQQCLDVIEPGNDVLVLVGDVPLIRGETLSALRAAMGDAAICVLSFLPDDPYGYGRLLRAENGDVIAIVEQKDTDAESVRIGECNSGIMIIRGDRLRDLLAGIGNNNAQGEYYLTDIVGLAADKGDRVTALACDEPGEVSGVNDQRQLASVERLYRASQASKLMQQGAKLYDPGRIDIRGSLQVGRDVEIDVNCVFEGEVVLGDNVRIGANCIIRDTRIGMDSEIKPMTSIEAAEIGRGVVIGPFARIRPGTKLADRVRIGNFVETKQSQIGEESKVNHLSYIGDTEIGTGVNIGAGTITCNYDGANKFRTVIEDGVFIGSDTQLVAPVRVEKNATVGAGSTITRDVPGEKLTISRAKQVTIEGWVRPRKKE
ncbi:MAG: bifunctional UDP-N-acetylglucosamine diphosphorylase/glucosamine-1-phosphate N-acetyltransferase GlmU [Gammaproteobacteria bacterium]